MKIYTVVGKGMRKLFLMFLFASLAVTGAYASGETFYCSIFPDSVVDSPTTDDYDFKAFLLVSTNCNDEEDLERSFDYNVDNPFPGSSYTSGGGDGYHVVCGVWGTCEYVVFEEMRDIDGLLQNRCTAGQMELDLVGFEVGHYLMNTFAGWYEEEYGDDIEINYEGQYGVLDDKAHLTICVDCVNDGTSVGSWQIESGTGRETQPVYQEKSALHGYLACPHEQISTNYQCTDNYYRRSGSGSSLSCSMCPVADNMCTVPLSGSSCSNKAQGTTDAGLAAITDCCVPVGTYYDTKGKYRTNTCCPYVQN